MVATGQPGTGASISGRILLDSPTASPALGYAQIGRALATIIKQSEPRFALGIFGGWGSGKTTLMQAIRGGLVTEQGIVVADFNAWRFEREPQLLIPLLDTIRAALVRGSDAVGSSKDSKEKIRSIAVRVGQVVRALATGLSAQVGLPGAVTVSYDAGAALAALSSPTDPQNSQSLYVAAFAELDRAFRDLSAAGISRLVVFVDDLDRCLPVNALQVLESMKLFFDLPGFIFVVGLDEDIVDRAIRAKFASGNDPAAQPTGPEPADAPQLPQQIGREYVKKIFQVPYSIPPMLPQQLDDLLASLYQEASLEQAQLDDLTSRVRPYLGYVAVGRRVNPREVKRFINAYTLQTLIRPDLDPDTVLGLQTLAFRYDWVEFYEAILADSALFVDALRRYRRGQASDQFSFEDMAPGLSDLPPSLASYLRSDCAEALTRHPALDTYLSSLQSYHSVNQWELDAFRQIGSLQREIRLALGSGDAVRSARSVAETASTVTDSLSDSLVGGSSAQIDGFKSAIEQVRSATRGVTDRLKGSQENNSREAEARAAMDELSVAVERAREELRLIRDSSILRP
jgi:KAP family P-loop domain